MNIYFKNFARLMMAVCAAIVLLAPASLEARSGKLPGVTLTEDERVSVQRVNKYLNRVVHLEGDFIQIAPNGYISEGRFYLRRPGRMRFDYKQPNPIKVVADGFWIGVTNSKLKTTDRIPIKRTPIWALVEKRINLFKNARILGVEVESELITLTIEDIKGQSNGQLTLVFQGENPVLKQWIVKDAQGLTTTVSIFNLIENKPARNSLFVIKDITPFQDLNQGR